MNLLQLMQSQVPILEQMLRLSEKQLNLVRLGNVTLLTQLLERKYKVYDAFEALERKLDPYRHIEPQDRKWKDEQERLDCDAAIRQCDKLLAAILELDRQCTTEFSQQKDEIQRKFNKMGTSGKAAAAYAKQNVMPVSPKTLSPSRFDFTE